MRKERDSREAMVIWTQGVHCAAMVVFVTLCPHASIAALGHIDALFRGSGLSSGHGQQWQQYNAPTTSVLLISTITTPSPKFTSILSLEVIHHMARPPQSTCRESTPSTFSRAKPTPKTFGICKTGLQALTNNELRGDRGAVHGDCNYPVLLRRQGALLSRANPISPQRFISPGLQLAV